MDPLKHQIRNLTPEQRSLLFGQIRARASAASDPPCSASRPRASRGPLSFGQERLWVLDQINPGSRAFHMCGLVELSGSLDRGTLEKALRSVVDRHEALRTTFGNEGGIAFQKISETVCLDLLTVDLSGIPAPAKVSEHLATELAKLPFDLARAPLLRVLLCRLSPRVHYLALSIHHIIADGWAIQILIHEVLHFYARQCGHDRPTLPELPLQYLDFAQWERDASGKGDKEASLAYWKAQLEGAPDLLLKDTDYPRPSHSEWPAGYLDFEVSEDDITGLRTIARRIGVTTYCLLLGFFLATLHRQFGVDDLVVGVDVAGRERTEFEPVIGLFANQLPLRTRITDECTGLDLVQRVQRALLGVMAHQQVPLQRIVQNLRIPRNSGYSPVHQVVFSHFADTRSYPEIPALQFNFRPIPSGTAKNDLSLVLLEAGGRVTGTLEYRTDLFRRPTVASFLAAYLTTVKTPEALMAAPISSLVATSTHERSCMDSAIPARPGGHQFRSIKPKAIHLNATDPVRATRLSAHRNAPVLISPGENGPDLHRWISEHLAEVQGHLRTVGAVLFRGFPITTAQFEQVARSVFGDLFAANGEHPRENVTGAVYTPVFFPPNRRLLWHNENSFNQDWPLYIGFCCLQEATSGGETPIVDSREVYRRLPDWVREPLLERGVMYVRNYGDGPGLDWRTVFQTNDRAEVERACSDQGIVWEWRSHDRLRTRCVRPAAVAHPVTGEASWFTQVQHWHPACLDRDTRDSLLALYAEEDLPRNARYGDGTPIPAEVMAALCAIYAELEVVFPWRQRDILLLDNVLCAHGRNPLQGDRKLLVAMGELRSFGEPQLILPR